MTNILQPQTRDQRVLSDWMMGVRVSAIAASEKLRIADVEAIIARACSVSARGIKLQKAGTRHEQA